MRKSCSRAPVLQVQGRVTRTRSHAGAAAAVQKATEAADCSAADASARTGRAAGCDLGALVPCKPLLTLGSAGQAAAPSDVCTVLAVGCTTTWTVHGLRPTPS